nr:hypothetical protein Iba_chr04eCG1780 [Ipomoea batatas]
MAPKLIRSEEHERSEFDACCACHDGRL